MFKIEPIFEDIHWLPGMMPENVQREPDIANAFIIERGRSAYLIDTGVGPEFRRTLNDFLSAGRYDSVTLINTHAHPDHICNNDLLNGIQAREKKHLIHEAGVPRLDPYEWLKTELRMASPAYSPFTFGSFPLNVEGAILRVWERMSPDTAYRFFARMSLRIFEPVHGRTPYLAPLLMKDRTVIRSGGLEFQGWRAGDLLLLDDGGHSPDSITVYDPVRRVLVVGDLTYEYNPLWPSGSYGRMLDRMKAYRALAAAGEVTMLADGHQNTLFRGNEITAVLERLIALHEQRRSAVAAAAGESGARTVDDVRRALMARDPDFARLAKDHDFPKKICFIRTMIAVALREMDEARHAPGLPAEKEGTKMTEAEKNSMIVQDGLQSFIKGDIKAVLNLLTEDVDWQSPVMEKITEEISWAKPRHGRQEVAAFFKDLFGKIKNVRLDLLTFTAQDDRVIVEGVTNGTAVTTGREFVNDWLMTFTLRNGKIVRFRQYYDSADVAVAFHRAGKVRPAA